MKPQTRADPAAELAKQLVEKYKFAGLQLTMSADPQPNGWVGISLIHVQKRTGQRVGSKVMQEIVDWADREKRPITLTATEDFGVPLDVLAGWYERFGFKRTGQPHQAPGSENLSVHMTRQPKRRVRAGLAIKAEHRGVMIALYPAADVAAKLAVPGGEAPENMHVTLAYLGKLAELPEDAVQRAVQAVQQVCQQFGPLAGEFGGIGRFAGGDGQDVVHATCDVPGLVELRVALCAALRAAGLPAKASHGFDPHVTIQYLEKGQDSPVLRMDPVPCQFSSVWVVSGDVERHECPLAGTRVVLAGPSFSFDDFDDDDQPAAPREKTPLELARSFLTDLAVGDVIKVGAKKFDVYKHEPGSVTVYLRATGTKGTKFYVIDLVDELGTFGVWQAGGSGQKLGEPVARGPAVVFHKATAFTIIQRRAFRRDRLVRRMLGWLAAVQDGTAAPRTIDTIRQATGLNPEVPAQRDRIRARLRRLTAVAQAEILDDLSKMIDRGEGLLYGKQHGHQPHHRVRTAGAGRTGPRGRGPASGGRGHPGRRAGWPREAGEVRVAPPPEEGGAVTAGPQDYREADWYRQYQESLPEDLRDKPEGPAQDHNPELDPQPGDWPVLFTGRAQRSMEDLEGVEQFDQIELALVRISRGHGRPVLEDHLELHGQEKKPKAERFWRAHAGAEHRIVYAIRPGEIWVYDVVNKNEADRLYEKVKRHRVSDLTVSGNHAPVAGILDLTANRLAGRST